MRHSVLTHIKRSCSGLLALIAMTVQVCAAPTTTVTVGGQTYNVTYTSTSYTSNPALFTQANMPWWGDVTLGGQFATAVGLLQLQIDHQA